MDLAITKGPKLIPSDLLLLILFIKQCKMADLTDFGRTILLMRHETFSTRSTPTFTLTALYCEENFLHTVG